jgi:RNA polymerase sigma-70 factor (ECF subfamily)
LPSAVRDTKFPRTGMLMHDEMPDLELVRMAQNGELAGLDELTKRHERRVYTLAWRMLRQEQDAEDVTQQAFLSALENLEGSSDTVFKPCRFRINLSAA